MNNLLDVNKFYASGKDAKRRKAKWKRQRIHRGFCDRDWWDLDMFFCKLFSAALRHYAKNTIGFSPAIASTMEEYQARIIALADRFETMLNWETIHNNRTDYAAVHEELYDYTKVTFAELAEVFWSLWD